MHPYLLEAYEFLMNLSYVGKGNGDHAKLISMWVTQTR